MQQLGNKTETLFLKGFEAHKLHHEFAVAAGNGAVRKGMPVVLTSDGNVKPAPVGTKNVNIIGYSIHNGQPGELVTIAMKAYAIMYAKPNKAVPAGPVTYAGTNTAEPQYNAVEAMKASTDSVPGNEGSVMAWALDEAEAANDLIRIAVI